MNPIRADRKIVPGQPIPVSKLVELYQLANRGKAQTQINDPVKIIETPHGQRIKNDLPKEWIVKITSVDASTPKRYEFKEVYQDVSTGNYVDKPDGLVVADDTKTWAIAPQGKAYLANDVVRVKVHHADGNLFEIVDTSKLTFIGVKLVKVATTSIANNTDTTYTFDGSEFNTSPTTFTYTSPANRININESGYYHIGGMASLTPNRKFTQFRLQIFLYDPVVPTYRQLAFQQYWHEATAAVMPVSLTTSVVRYVNSGEFVELRSLQSNLDGLNGEVIGSGLGSYGTHFWVYKVG